jgi:hypothetical protein
MKKVSVNDRVHLCLFALRNIEPGTEIVYNYGDSKWPWRKKVSWSGFSLCIWCASIMQTINKLLMRNLISKHQSFTRLYYSFQYFTFFFSWIRKGINSHMNKMAPSNGWTHNSAMYTRWSMCVTLYTQWNTKMICQVSTVQHRYFRPLIDLF